MKLVKEKTVFQLMFLPNVMPVSVYLVEEEDGFTLIDAAMAFCTKNILRTAERLGKPIKRIILTHAHVDHVGALDPLKEALPDVIVYISERDARLLAGDASVETSDGIPHVRGGIPKQIKTIPDILLKEGDEIGSLVAIATPGHTPGSFSFIDKRNQIVIVGDAFQTQGGVAVAGQMKITFPFPALATSNKNQAIESAYKIKELQPSVLAVGHGKMIKNPLNSITKAIEEAEKNTKKGQVS
ncbi:MBL fold metallo-hydrolase [Bacillus alkalicellulosilyticus]|uniref:MBL fold metallo-hydrolase n=1 Tax=Alkalihalobacterium alkalicellulosilyticum TaxID=1912214 RepID=UPI000997262E|nr:MBL fold metallo-hydrolase [Bacillus alkalicellulosilyticus]